MLFRSYSLQSPNSIILRLFVVRVVVVDIVVVFVIFAAIEIGFSYGQ